MKFSLFGLLLFFISCAFFSHTVQGASLASQLSGRILLSVEENGEAWYVYPKDLKRYFLGRPDDAFLIMRQRGLGINERDFANLRDGSSLANDLKGLIVIRVEKDGEAWYINPLNLKKYYLGRPADAFALMRQLGLGISFNNLLQIPRSSSGQISLYNSYQRKSIVTSVGEFSIDVVTINLANPKLKVMTLTAGLEECDLNCPARSLSSFNEEGRGFTAINGTYFDTGASRPNYSFYPAYNSLRNIFINERQLVFPTTGPIMAFSLGNQFHYFSDARDFASKQSYESRFGILQAAIGNQPALIENGVNILNEGQLDNKQRNTKSLRNAFGYADNKLYLIVARNSTVPDLAKIVAVMHMQFAINLDGGGSSALIYDNVYKVGPGRNIVNAIVFSEE